MYVHLSAAFRLNHFHLAPYPQSFRPPTAVAKLSCACSGLRSRADVDTHLVCVVFLPYIVSIDPTGSTLCVPVEEHTCVHYTRLKRLSPMT